MKHTAAIGAAYSVPYAVGAAIKQKDIGKGAETMMWGTMIPFAGHGIFKGVGKAGGAVKDRVRKSFFNIPKTSKHFELMKEKLAVSATIDPNLIPDASYVWTDLAVLASFGAHLTA